MASGARGLCYAPSVLFSIILTVAGLVGVTFGAPAGNLVTKLPGQPEVSLQQYSGYVTVDDNNGRNLFYYFVEALSDPQDKPLALWLNGGPGCSSLGGGAFSELGPFYPDNNGKALLFNPNSWIQEANIIFLESPAGVGFSFSKTSSDYSTGDEKTAKDSLTFILKWLALYSEYQNRDFYIAGESYAGHYVPQLAAAILKNNQLTGPLIIPLKGILLGNPLLDNVIDLGYAPLEYGWGHGMVSEATHDKIVRECKFSKAASENQACEDATMVAMEEASFHVHGSGINPYDVLEDVCVPSIAREALLLRELYTGVTINVDPCIEHEETTYLNMPEVQTALHAQPTRWTICTRSIEYDTVGGLLTEIIPVLSDLIRSGLKVWVFSGDEDEVVPLVGTRKLINYLAESTQMQVTSPYRPWFQGQQVGGWSITWGSLSFVTVRGAGHMVPQTQPARALQVFSSFIAGQPLPLNPLGSAAPEHK